jgi:transcriptional regulator GlxA family with amidase domain
MEQHVGRALPLEALACKLDLSPRQLERLFKAETGKSPQAFAKHVRLRTAAWLLTSSDRTVVDIALSCGFADASHLGREFRKQFGVPPATYRDKGVDSADAMLPDGDAVEVPALTDSESEC